jgi:hypothetical protein
MESRNLKLYRSDMELNMPPRWGFSSFDAGGYNDVAPPELKNGSSAPFDSSALIKHQRILPQGRSEGEPCGSLNKLRLI